jgi:hypothetical protein
VGGLKSGGLQISKTEKEKRKRGSSTLSDGWNCAYMRRCVRSEESSSTRTRIRVGCRSRQLRALYLRAYRLNGGSRDARAAGFPRLSPHRSGVERDGIAASPRTTCRHRRRSRRSDVRGEGGGSIRFSLSPARACRSRAAIRKVGSGVPDDARIRFRIAGRLSEEEVKQAAMRACLSI